MVRASLSTSSPYCHIIWYATAQDRVNDSSDKIEDGMPCMVEKAQMQAGLHKTRHSKQTFCLVLLLRLLFPSQITGKSLEMYLR